MFPTKVSVVFDTGVLDKYIYTHTHTHTSPLSLCNNGKPAFELKLLSSNILKEKASERKLLCFLRMRMPVQHVERTVSGIVSCF